jgi:hypothetical protein
MGRVTMIPRTLYLETPIWNRLAAGDIDVDVVLRPLARSGIVPVISTQLICELAATFLSKRLSNPLEFGRQLFAHLQKYVERGVPCLKMNCQLLQDEAMDVTGQIRGFNLELSETDYGRMAAEIQKLANGQLEESVQTFLESRRRLSKNARAEAAEYGRDRGAFRSVCEGSFGAFLHLANPIEVLRLLRDHLRNEFPDKNPATLTEVAAALLRSSDYRVANAMVRADLYTSWRAIRAGTLARDVLDDCFHLVNASYCDMYATMDLEQSKYAPIVLGSTEVLYFDGTTPVSDWLTSDVCRN